MGFMAARFSRIRFALSLVGRWLWRRAGVDLLLVWAMAGVMVGISHYLPVREQQDLFRYAAGILAVVGLMVIRVPEPSWSDRLRPSLWLFVMLVVFVLFFGVAYGDSRDWDWMVMNCGLMAAALPPLVFVLRLVIRNLLLLVGALVPFGFAVVLALRFVVTDEKEWEFLVLPLVLLVGPLLCWALFLVGVIRLARWRRGHRTWGPLTEASLMLVVFAPLVALSVLVPGWFGWEERWLAVSILLVGLLLSNVVGAPLRQLMLDLGGLSPGVVDDDEGKEVS